MAVLTLIKDSFKRYAWEELVDFSQDICFVSKRCVSIPDLYDIFPITDANTDTDNLVIWGTAGTTESQQLSLIEEGCMIF